MSDFFVDTSTNREMDLLKSYDKYGKELCAPIFKVNIVNSALNLRWMDMF